MIFWVPGCVSGSSWCSIDLICFSQLELAHESWWSEGLNKIWKNLKIFQGCPVCCLLCYLCSGLVSVRGGHVKPYFWLSLKPMDDELGGKAGSKSDMPYSFDLPKHPALHPQSTGTSAPHTHFLWILFHFFLGCHEEEGLCEHQLPYIVMPYCGLHNAPTLALCRSTHGQGQDLWYTCLEGEEHWCTQFAHTCSALSSTIGDGRGLEIAYKWSTNRGECFIEIPFSGRRLSKLGKSPQQSDTPCSTPGARWSQVLLHPRGSIWYVAVLSPKRKCPRASEHVQTLEHGNSGSSCNLNKT